MKLPTYIKFQENREMKHIISTLLACVLLVTCIAGIAAAMQPVDGPTFEPTDTPTGGNIGGDVGYYEVTSIPSGADVHFDGKYEGTTPISIQVLTTATPGHTISVSETGYQTWTRTMPGNPAAGQTIAVTANLIAVPTTEPTITITSVGGDVGWYHITSVPSGGEVTFDGSSWGPTPVTVQVFTTGAPGHSVTVTKPGYQTWSQTLSGNPAAGQTIEITANLNPVNPTGNIYVTSSPSGATATLDSSDRQTTPCSFTGITPGYHTVQVTLPGYQSYSSSVNLKSGQTVNVNANLNPSTSTGWLQATSSPRGADLYIDGSYRGETPTTIGNLWVGNHNVVLRLAGYQQWSGTVNIQAGATTSISPTLTPNSNPVNGDIVVTSQPAGASVYLDGNYQGQTYSGQPFDILDVSPGAHTISLSLNGYQDYSGTVMVSSGQTAQVSVTLNPSTKPGSGGNIVISSAPSGADAYLDNQYKGITPLTLTGISPGTVSMCPSSTTCFGPLPITPTALPASSTKVSS
jgi:hypothetical protein